jgi:endonuclease III
MITSDRCRIDEIALLLKDRYGPRPWKQHRPPIDELVLTILSQHTSDLNSERAFAQLTDRFPTWEAIIAAPTNEVADAIRSGGLAEQKAPRIQAVLRTILELTDGWDLDFLADLPVGEGRKWLTNLPGVGPKTASCVLLFSLGLPAMPVDTHVHRVAGRLGLVQPKETAEGTQLILEKKVGADRDRIYALHMSLIAHGRAVCIARRPRCGDCPLTRCCDYYLELSADPSNPAPSGQG